MTYDPSALTHALAVIARKGLLAVGDAMGTGGSRLTTLIRAFAPEQAVGWFQGRRLRVRQVKAQEQMFDQICVAVVDAYKKRAQRLAATPERLQHPLVRSSLDEMEGDIRLLATFRHALKLCQDQPMMLARSAEESAAGGISKAAGSSQDEMPSPDGPSPFQEDVSWWDTMEALARRRNEPWRVDLMAKAILENDREPGCISLKSIWEIGMMEADDFGCLAAFCDSALYIDGKAMVLIDPEMQAKFEFDDWDQVRSLNLAHAISRLVDAGLVVRSSIQFDISDRVELGYQDGPTYMSRSPQTGDEAVLEIRMDGFGASDVAMDICRLYEPNHNLASKANLDAFKQLMKDASKDNPRLGKFSFRKGKKSL